MALAVTLLALGAVALLVFQFVRLRQDKRHLARLPYLPVHLPQDLRWQVAGERIFPLRPLEVGGQLFFGGLWLLGGVWGLWRAAHGQPSEVPPAAWPLLLLAPGLLWQAGAQWREWHAHKGQTWRLHLLADEERLSLEYGAERSAVVQGRWAGLAWAQRGEWLHIRGEQLFFGLEPLPSAEAVLKLPLRALDNPEGRVLRQLLHDRVRVLG